MLCATYQNVEEKLRDWSTEDFVFCEGRREDSTLGSPIKVLVKPLSRRIIHPLCKTLPNCFPRQIRFVLQRSSVTVELYWLLIGVPLAWLSNIKPQKYLSKIEPDARCIVAPTDEECFPGIAIKFRAQQTLRDGMHQVRLIAELHVVKQSRRNVNESLGRRGDGNRC